MTAEDAIYMLSTECERLRTENAEMRGRLAVAQWEGHGPGAIDPTQFHRR